MLGAALGLRLLQRVSLAALPVRLLALTCVCAANVGVGACLYRLASGHPWSTALFRTYAVLFRAPGIGVMGEPSFLAGLVLNALFIFSLFVFAAVIGMISEEVKDQIQAIRVGAVKLPLRGHVLVLGWGQHAIPLLKQLSHAQADARSCLHRRPVVVLAEASKAAMDGAISAAFRGTRMQVFARSGTPTKARDLERAAAEHAHTVFVLQPAACSSPAAGEAVKTAALISLACLRETHAEPGTAAGARAAARAAAALRALCARLAPTWLVVPRRISACGGRGSEDAGRPRSRAMRAVVQAPYAAGAGRAEGDVISFLQHATATGVHGDSIHPVRQLSQGMLNMLVCQTALEPGAASVFRELLRAGASTRLAWCSVDEELQGCSFGHAGQLFPDTVLLGVQAAGSQHALVLNPPGSHVLMPGDRLVGLTCLAHMRACPAAKAESHVRRYTRSISRVSSMASPQLCSQGANNSRSSSGGGGAVASPTAQQASGSGAGMRVIAARQRGTRIIMLGDEAGVKGLLQQLELLAPVGSSVTVVLLDSQEAGQQPCSQPASSAGRQLGCGEQVDGSSSGGGGKQQRQQCASNAGPAGLLAVRYVRTADPCSCAALLDAGILLADALILGSALAPSTPAACTEGDALVAAAMLAVQQALCTAGGGACSNSAWQHAAAAAAAGSDSSGSSSSSPCPSRLHVVTMLSSYSVRRSLRTFLRNVLLGCSFSYELMVLDEFAAGMLVVVAQEPANSLVIDALLVQPGSTSSTLRMLSSKQLGLEDTNPSISSCSSSSSGHSFSSVRLAAQRQRCTALGYRRANGRMVLVPANADDVLLAPEDRVVVLARGAMGGCVVREGL